MTGGGEEVASRVSPTVRRRMLAAELKKLRTSLKISRDEAARHIDVAPSTITRIEAMQAVAHVGHVSLLLDLYQVTDPDQREFLLSLAREARKPGWWTSYKGIIPVWFETFVGLEAEAVELRGYEAELVPGLLQTEHYYRAVLEVGPNTEATAADIEKKIAFRMERQKRIFSAGGPRLWVILNEAVLMRPIGGAKVMHDQLQHLVTCSADPNIHIQVLPFSVGAHVAMDGSFMILEFPERSHTDVVYLESKSDARYLEDTDTVDRYNLMFNHLRAQALSFDGSRERLLDMVDHYR